MGMNFYARLASFGFLLGLLPFAGSASVAVASTAGCAGSTIVGSPSPGPVGNHLSGVVSLSPSNAWAVGAAYEAAGMPPTLLSRPLIAHWDGNAWRSAPSPTLPGGGALSSISALNQGNIWAVGHQGSSAEGSPLVERWDGSKWKVVSSPAVPSGFLLGVSARSENDIWAVGIRLGSTSYSLIEHWDGASWRVVPSPNPSDSYNEIDSVVATSAGTAWAVGFSLGDINSVPMLARWDGSRWNLVASPVAGLPSSLLRSVAARSEKDIWAVGQSRSEDGSVVQPLVEHWNGRDWRIVKSSSPTSQSSFVGVAAAQGRVWAVGVRVDGFTNRTLMERLGDGQFSAVPSANRGAGDNGLEAAAIAPNGVVWAVGSDQGLTKGESLVVRGCASD